SIAEHVTSRLCTFQLIADPGTPLVLRARPGKAQLFAALEALSGVRAMGKTPYLDLVASGLRFVSPGGAIVLMFTTLEVEPEGLFWVLSEAKRRSARLAAVAFDDTTFLALEEAQELGANGVDKLELLRRSLGGFGVDPVVVRSRDDLAAV